MDFRKLNLDIIKGKAGKKVLWQPRIGCWKTDKERAGIPLPSPYNGKDLWEIYAELGCSPRPYEFNECFKTRYNSGIKIKEVNAGDNEQQTVISTPVGEIREIRKKGSAGLFIVKHFIETDDDIKVQEFIVKNTEWYFDEELYGRLNKKLGNMAAPCIFMPRIPIQRCYIDLMGVENTIYAIHDGTKKLESLFLAIEENDRLLMQVIGKSPIEIINYGDNIHSGTLPPNLFEKYALPVYKERSETLRKMGKFVHAHWDGDTKPILKYARETGLNGIEAITPLPQGDVTLDEIKEALGDDIFLLDGIPAIYFDERYPVSVLKDCVHQLIEKFCPKLILGISDEISSTGDIERIRIVGEIVENFNNNSK